MGLNFKFPNGLCVYTQGITGLSDFEFLTVSYEYGSRIFYTLDTNIKGVWWAFPFVRFVWVRWGPFPLSDNFKESSLLLLRHTTSPVQNGHRKDFSNPLTAVILPKNEQEEASSSKTRRKLPRTLTRSKSRARSNHTKKQQKNIEKIVRETLEQIFLKPQTEDSVTETPEKDIHATYSDPRSTD
ncbi:hypothetical protein RND71_019276 [Anisodus tanguticus]|uniref:Uncharacterized protein n=1 Tax=Anisodus tanguticus TaxID=243964 RepID=A0AAE1VGB0_9SOLA|nr:hypothetical protein RND71_019276 [Anisodus tanguticus]